MASMRDIKRRKSSIQSTQQITKAMKLVSTVKLQRARANAERSQMYYRCVFDTVNNILSRVGHLEHKYLLPGKSSKKAVIVITSNRGLAGGYNANVVKLVTRDESFQKEDLLIYAVGNKGKDMLQKNGYTISQALPDIIDEPSYSAAMKLTEDLLKSFAEDEIGEIYLAYTTFQNTVSHTPTMLKLLPVDGTKQQTQTSSQEQQDSKTMDDALMNFEPEDMEALDFIIPKYIASLIYGAMVEALASENGARMQAMDNATSNAEDMIEDLALKYNRARQGSITQELTEIIAGAEALG